MFLSYLSDEELQAKWDELTARIMTCDVQTPQGVSQLQSTLQLRTAVAVEMGRR